MSEWATNALFPSELRSETKETTELYYITHKQESGFNDVRSETEYRVVDWTQNKHGTNRWRHYGRWN